MIRRVPIAVLFPRFDHGAIEERYASWQSRQRLAAGVSHSRVVLYDRDSPAATIAGTIDEDYVLVVTDPLLIPSPHLGSRLQEALDATGAAVAVPVSNEGDEPRQRTSPPWAYLTLRELEEMFLAFEGQPAANVIDWQDHDPGVFLCRTSTLASLDAPPREAIGGLRTAIVTNEYVHRWPPMRAQARIDLLDRISIDARRILEFGCGEAHLGVALQQRQQCRVVGIELDSQAAAIARTHIDEVHQGDAREIVRKLDERFDCIVGSEIVEHIDDPWTFLEDLRRVAGPGGALVLSIPNVANASLIADLLRGRFDYVYMGLTCVGHVRFFTRQTILDMLSMAGWTDVRFEPQEAAATPAREHLLAALAKAGLEHSREDLLPTGYYVTARNGAAE